MARRWKTQINEIAKAGAGFEFLPEADHNALAGLINPADILAHTVTLFLHAPSDHPRNHLRLDLTRHGFTVEGLTSDVYEAVGESRLAHIWTALHFGDYASYYLAMAYGSDPTPVEALEKFKASMKAASQVKIDGIGLRPVDITVHPEGYIGVNCYLTNFQLFFIEEISAAKACQQPHPTQILQRYRKDNGPPWQRGPKPPTAPKCK